MIDRLRPKLDAIAGARLFLTPMSSTGVRAGGRQGNGAYQYTIQADTLDDLNKWVPKITDALQNVPELEDVNSDQQDKGLEVDLKIDRATASRLGLTASQIDNTLYDAFGQRQVSTIYKDKNQYHVVMEVAPEFWQSPETLRDIYVSTAAALSAAPRPAPAPAAPSPATTHHGRHDGFQHRHRRGRRRRPTRCATSSSTPSPAPRAAAARPAPRSRPGSRRWCRCRPSPAYGPGTTPLSVNHQGPFVATTFSFNLPPGVTAGPGADARSTAPWPRSMCRSRSMARSPAPPAVPAIARQPAAADRSRRS